MKGRWEGGGGRVRRRGESERGGGGGEGRGGEGRRGGVWYGYRCLRRYGTVPNNRYVGDPHRVTARLAWIYENPTQVLASPVDLIPTKPFDTSTRRSPVSTPRPGASRPGGCRSARSRRRFYGTLTSSSNSIAMHAVNKFDGDTPISTAQGEARIITTFSLRLDHVLSAWPGTARPDPRRPAAADFALSSIDRSPLP